MIVVFVFCAEEAICNHHSLVKNLAGKIRLVLNAYNAVISGRAYCSDKGRVSELIGIPYYCEAVYSSHSLAVGLDLYVSILKLVENMILVHAHKIALLFLCLLKGLHCDLLKPHLLCPVVGLGDKVGDF